MIIIVKDELEKNTSLAQMKTNKNIDIRLCTCIATIFSSITPIKNGL